MQLIIEYAKSEGLKRISGQILQENTVMLKMCRELGFEIKTDPDDRGLRDGSKAVSKRVRSGRSGRQTSRLLVPHGRSMKSTLSPCLRKRQGSEGE